MVPSRRAMHLLVGKFAQRVAESEVWKVILVAEVRFHE